MGLERILWKHGIAEHLSMVFEKATTGLHWTRMGMGLVVVCNEYVVRYSLSDQSTLVIFNSKNDPRKL